jgi:hypothetical protein
VVQKLSVGRHDPKDPERPRNDLEFSEVSREARNDLNR